MTPGETMTSDQLAGELVVAMRTLDLARFRLDQDACAYGLRFGRHMSAVGHDRDLWRRFVAALRRVRYLELLSE
jgi:hypothetical protein